MGRLSIGIGFSDAMERYPPLDDRIRNPDRVLSPGLSGKSCGRLPVEINFGCKDSIRYLGAAVNLKRIIEIKK
jgi:hypothetical protein